jgi:hypothetical protein
MIVQGEWAIVGFSDAEVHNALAVFVMMRMSS